MRPDADIARKVLGALIRLEKIHAHVRVQLIQNYLRREMNLEVSDALVRSRLERFVQQDLVAKDTVIRGKAVHVYYRHLPDFISRALLLELAELTNAC